MFNKNVLYLYMWIYLHKTINNNYNFNFLFLLIAPLKIFSIAMFMSKPIFFKTQWLADTFPLMFLLHYLYILTYLLYGLT